MFLRLDFHPLFACPYSISTLDTSISSLRFIYVKLSILLLPFWSYFLRSHPYPLSEFHNCLGCNEILGGVIVEMALESKKQVG